MMRQIELHGSHYDMGWQHGNQVLELLPHIRQVVEHRLGVLGTLGLRFRPYLDELHENWMETAGPMMEMLKGMADALSLEWDSFFRYTVATYLLDRANWPNRYCEGCTVWAAGPPVTHQGEILLAKNRDYWPDHQDLQCLAWAKPAHGYAYTYLTSAGSPGVFSSGMNETGLSVADTHVVSCDIGPGLPRYAVMMEILEHCDRVTSALDYIQSVRHVGNGTITLADASGGLLVVETGYNHTGAIWPEDGRVISANHFVSPELQGKWYERNRKERHNNSQKRYIKVQESLQASVGEVNLTWAKAIMSSHSLGGRGLSTICNHYGNSRRSVTISSIIFLPQSRRFHLTDGIPCQNQYSEYDFSSKLA